MGELYVRQKITDMRLFLLLLGIAMLLICLMYSLDVGGPPANIGYFLVISSVFIGCAIYRDNPSSVKRGRFEIYRELSEESKTMDDLVEASSRRLQIHDYTDANKIIKSSIS